MARAAGDAAHYALKKCANRPMTPVMRFDARTLDLAAWALNLSVWCLWLPRVLL
ncbi:MAG: hypothetical protein ACR2LK_09035 [Solirubrobacteraceae bacterium]